MLLFDYIFILNNYIDVCFQVWGDCLHISIYNNDVCIFYINIYYILVIILLFIYFKIRNKKAA